MSLAVELDRAAGLPLYQQIAEQIKAQISEGRLPHATRLPTIRALAKETGVTRLTVQNAYAELQADGWIESTVGRGTFVREGVRPQALLASLGHDLTPDSVINDIVQADGVVGVRSMAGAYPESASFPVDALWRALMPLQHEAASLLRYSAPAGEPSLRLEIAALLQRESGIQPLPNEILVTSGVTQGLALAAQALARPGEYVLVEEPTYLGFLNILQAQGLRPISVPLDEQGPRLDTLARLLDEVRPRFYYTIPTFHNPTGICFSHERREALVALAARHDLLLIEDDMYRPLAYDTPPPPPLYLLDRTQHVIYLSGFSKSLFPGIRIGYLVAPAPLQQRLLALKRAADVCGPALLHRALARYLQAGQLQPHLRRLLPRYRERRDALLAALEAYMPEGSWWSRPAGGFCCWVRLPEGYGYDDLHQAALQQGLAFAPGAVFLSHPRSNRYLRLCFGNETPEMIRTGVELLGRLVRERMMGRGYCCPTEPWVPLV